MSALGAVKLARGGITPAPIASATRLEQLEELLGVMSLDLSGDQLERLSAASATEETA